MIGLGAICFALYFCNVTAVCPVAIAVAIEAPDPVSIAPSSSQYAEDSLYNHRVLLFAYKDPPTPQK